MLLASLAHPLAAQQIPPGYEQGLYEVRIPRVFSTTVPALVDTSGAVLIPVAALLDATGIPVQRERGDSLLSIPFLGTAGRTVLDLRARQIRRPDRVVPLAPREALALGGEVYLSTARLADLLQAQVAADPGALTVTVSRNPPFPAELAAQARERRERVRASSGTPEEPRVAYQGGTGGGVLDWGLTASGVELSRGLSIRSELGMAVFGGDLSVGGVITPQGPARTTQSGWNWSYRRGFPEARLLRQVQAGDILIGGALLRSVHGVSFTNRRLVREQIFGQVLLTPDVPRGWEYEVYQNGELLGFSEAGTRTAVPVPLRYGNTPLQVRMFSPAGQEVISEVLYQVPPTQLRRGAAEYSVGAGVCPNHGCDYLAHATLDVGLAQWLTVGGGLEVTSDSLGRSVMPQGALNMAWLSGWTAQLQAARSAFTRGTLGYYGRGHVSGSLSAGINDPGSGQASFIPTTTRRWYAESFGSVRFGGRVHAVRAEARTEGPADGGVDRLRTSATLDLARSNLDAMYEYDRFGGGRLLTLGALFLTSSNGPLLLRNRPIGAGIGFGRTGLQLLEGTVTLQPQPSGYLTLATRWDLRRSSPSVTLGYNLLTRAARSQSRLATTPDGGLVAATAVSGALAYDWRGRMVPLGYGGVRDAGVMGVVFYDQNGNGWQDPGERAVPGVEVRIGSSRARTDSAGEYRTWNVVPYELSAVSVDTLRQIDPSWIPLTRATYIRPTPHMYNRVDFPLVHTRELAGSLVAGPGVATTGGVTLELREVVSGRKENVVTFSDGAFYVSRIRPGSYELRVAESSLRALRARAEPAVFRFTVPAAGEETLVEIPPVRLVRAPS